MLTILYCLGMASSDPDPMPKKKMPATVDEEVEFPRCWCGDLCKAKTGDDPFSYTKIGRAHV